MLYHKMSEKFHKEIRVYLRILYVLFFLTMIMMLLRGISELSVFIVMFKIGKYACAILSIVIFGRLWGICEKAVNQHDALVDRLAEEERICK